MHWREPVGTGIGTVGPVVWVGLGGFIGRAIFAALERHAVAAGALVIVIVTIFAVGGLVIFWVTAEEIDFWRLG